MTRDEAIRKILPIVGHTPSFCEAWIDAYVALGMLKLDEPKTFPQKLRDFINDHRLAQGGAMERLENLHLVLADCDLKIVEK